MVSFKIVKNINGNDDKSGKNNYFSKLFFNDLNLYRKNINNR